MPPKNNSKQNFSGNAKSEGRAQNDHFRSKREEHKVAETPAPSGPTMRAQITNTAKTSSGKSFLDVLRTGGVKRPAAVEKPRPPETVEPATQETEVLVAADPVVEPVVPAAEVAPDPIEEAPVVVEETVVQDKPQPAVAIPENNTNFSWANDDDYTFVNEFVSQSPIVTSQSKPMAYTVTYPDEVLEAQTTGMRIAFTAPPDNQDIASAVAELEKERNKLYNDRHMFEECCKQKDIEMNDKHARLIALERQLNDQSDSLQRERSRLLEQQQQQQLMQQSHQQGSLRGALPMSSQQQQPPPPPPPPQAPQQGANSYTYPSGMQENMQWGAPMRPDHWAPNPNVMVPPYDHNHYYGGAPYQQPRGKHFVERGGDIPHIGRGNQMRGGPHMGGFPGRPMAATDSRGLASDAGVNPIYNQRNQGGYMPPNNAPYSRW
uniref:Uncharacterized protein TCIL3000_11_7010 n=1 Tax=Trypanosoma congolense (strain IL3000) TaxID=1068625 RepID=G0V0V2_TRYCI|nr:unnamed protein product [Trypanosoma congolense IL3000]